MPKSEFMPDDPPESLMVFGRAMTDADASNLRAAIGEIDGAQPVSLATTVGSNNDRLWTEMAVLGWMTANDPPDLPAGTRALIECTGCETSPHEPWAHQRRRLQSPHLHPA